MEERGQSGGAEGEAGKRWSPAVPLALLVLLVLLFFGDPLLTGRALFFRDIYSNHLPLKALEAEQLRAGEIPLWNPLLSGGQPLLANPNLFTFHPASLLFFLAFDPVSAVNWTVALEVLLAGWFTWLLARRLGQGWAGAFFAAAAFAFSGFLLSLGNLLNVLNTAAWMPLTLFLFLRCRERPTGLRFAACALSLAVQLLGGDPGLALATVPVLLLFAWGGGEGRPPAGERLRGALLALAAGGAALGLAALQYLPFRELLQHSVRGWGFTYQGATFWSEHPLRLFELHLPRLFGDLDSTLPGALWGYRLFDDGYPLILSLYAGQAVLLFGAAALLRLRRDRPARPLALLFGLGILLALGGFTPFYRLLYLLPLGSGQRYPARFFALAALALALLAGREFGRLAAGRGIGQLAAGRLRDGEEDGAKGASPVRPSALAAGRTWEGEAQRVVVSPAALSAGRRQDGKEIGEEGGSPVHPEELAAGRDRDGEPRRSVIYPAALAAALLLGLLFAWLLVDPHPALELLRRAVAPVIPAPGVLEATLAGVLRRGLLAELFLLAAAGLGWAAARGLLRGRLFAALGLSLLLADLLSFNSVLNFTTDRQFFSSRPPAAETILAGGGAPRIWREEKPTRFGLQPPSPEKVWLCLWDRSLLTPATGLPLGLGYDLGIAADLLSPQTSAEAARRMHTGGTEERVRLLSLASVGFALAFQDLQHPDLQPILRTRDFSTLSMTVYRNRALLPRARLVEQAVARPDRAQALEEVLAPAFDWREAIVMEAPAGAIAEGVPGTGDDPGTGGGPGTGAVPGTGDVAGMRDLLGTGDNLGTGAAPETGGGLGTGDDPVTGGGSGLPAGACRIVVDRPGRVEIEVDAPRPSWLVLADTWFPGWTAEVDGRSRPILRANSLHRAVAVGPGERRVTFVYHPLAWRAGLSISLATVLALVVGAAIPHSPLRRPLRRLVKRSATPAADRPEPPGEGG